MQSGGKQNQKVTQKPKTIRSLSLIATIAMVLQLILPYLVPTAYASAMEYEFSDPTRFTTGSHAQINDSGVSMAQYRLNWTAAASDFGTSASVNTDLVQFHFSSPPLPSDANTFLFRADGKIYSCPTVMGCDGTSWNQELPTIDEVKDIDGRVKQHLVFLDVQVGVAVAVGDDAGVGTIHYSTNGGDSWTTATTPDFAGDGITSVDFVAGDGQDFVAILSDGQTVISSDRGINWDYDSAIPVGETASQLAWVNSILLLGTQDGSVYKSSDSGQTWDECTGVDIGSTIKDIAAPNNSSIAYISGQDFFYRVDASADMDSSINWANLSSSLPVDTWVSIDSMVQTNGGLLASISETSGGNQDGIVISSLNSGLNWIQADSALGGSRTGMGIGRIDSGASGDDDILWIVRDGTGNLDAYAGNGFGDNAWIIPNDPISTTEINSLSPSYGSSDSETVRVAFGFSSNPAGTWYFYSGGVWTSAVGTDSDNATDISSLTSSVLTAFDDQVVISGPVYTRIYLAGTIGDYSPMLISLDKLIVNYDDASGGSGDPDDALNDETPPTSDVIDLPEYQPEVPFTVSEWVTDMASGVDYAKLYYTKSQPAGSAADLVQYGTVKHGCPTECFTWDFSAPLGDGTYFFYSSAVDKAGNDNFADKFVGLPVGQIPVVEAQTKVDTLNPYVYSHHPEQDATLVPRDGNMSFYFSERMDTSTLDYGFYYVSGGQKVDAKPSITAVTWLPASYCDDEGACSYPTFDISLNMGYSGLKPDTEYFLVIRHIADKAGHDIQKNAIEPPGSQPAWMLSFTTAPVLDPDLTQSKIEITNLPDSGKFKPGDKVSFRATIRNSSNTTADLVSADIPIADGLAYCSNAGCAGATASSGTLIVQNDNGKITLHWTGQVIKGTDVLIAFDTRVVDPAAKLSITQDLVIDDGVHEQVYKKNVVVEVEENADFSSSVKAGTCFWMGVEQSCTNAVVGTVVHYTVTIKNTGNTPVERNVVDGLGSAYLDLVSGPEGVGWESLEYNSDSNTIEALGLWQPGQSLQFIFSGQIVMEADGLTITNVANIDRWDPDPSFSVFVPGISEPDQFPPMIVAQRPAADEGGVSPYTDIQIEFSKSMDTASFGYSLMLDNTEVDTSTWDIAWEEANGMPDSKVIITMPATDKLELASEYTLQVDSMTADTDGNTLADGGLPNPWKFITVDPTLAFTSPTDPIIKVQRDKVSSEVVISVVDKNTKEDYKSDSDTTIGILAETSSGSKTGNKRKISTTALFAASSTGTFVPSTETNIFHITVAKGKASASFYFRDSVSELLTLVAFPDPWNGWSATTKPALVTDEKLDELTNRLTLELASETVIAGQFSSVIKVSATAADGTSLRLPKTLYFHSNTTTGRFYDKSFKELPDYITIQALNPQSNLQYAANLSGSQASFYFKDSAPGNALITISDNAPLAPDINLQNANALIQVINPVEPEEIEKELEPVEDETGRVLESVVIDPTKAVLLPGGIKSFAAKALDTDGKEIKNALFKWYVVAGGGTIEKDGLDEDTHKTTFTAGDELGSFYDTVLVATLYNGKFGYATASVKVADIVDIGPGNLPTTGVSGIQLIFMAITLAAAVALAWVEHYEKTLAAESGNGGGK